MSSVSRLRLVTVGNLLNWPQIAHLEATVDSVILNAERAHADEIAALIQMLKQNFGIDGFIQHNHPQRALPLFQNGEALHDALCAATLTVGWYMNPLANQLGFLPHINIIRDKNAAGKMLRISRFSLTVESAFPNISR